MCVGYRGLIINYLFQLWVLPGLLALAIGYLCYRIAQALFPYKAQGMPPVVRLVLWVYGAAVLCYTVLPITPPVEIACGQGTDPQLIPGESLVYAYRLAKSASGWYRMINPYTVQYLLNILLFVPLGGILRLRWLPSVRSVTVVASGLSLVIESIQATDWFGLYPCMFRTAQIDDVLLNSLGAALGAIVMVSLMRSRKFGARAKRFKQWFCGRAEQ